MQRQKFSSALSIEYPYKKKVLIRETVLSELLCSEKVVVTAFPFIIRSCITNAQCSL